MFSIGDKVVYPLYGAGVIEDIEQKEINGEEQLYYIMRMPIGNLKIMLSVRKAEELGIRQIHGSEELMETICEVRVIRMSENWNQRYKDNMEKIKTGNLYEVAEVFRTLRERERERGLSSAEKKMLSTVKQIILSEIILSYDVERQIGRAHV